MGGWLESLVPWGTEVIVWAQSLSNEWLDAVWEFLTRLGYEEFYFVLLPLVYWCLNRRIGAGLGYVAMLSAWLNSVVKYLFKIPRPNDPRIRIPLPETSPSFLSGHAQNAVVNWGYLAIRFRNPIFTVIAVIVILGIGLSRIFLGVHFPQDVIGGWLLGLVLLLVYVWAEEPVANWIAGQRSAIQVALAAGVPVVLIFLHPADTQGHYPAEGAIVPMAALTGFGLGLIMERAWVRFTVEGAWWRRILRFLLGLVVVGVLYLGSRMIIPEALAYGLESLLRFVRYALVGWAGSFLAPWLFVRLRLAPREGEM
jgi:membrane-associated phospholipid phosphatase